MREFQRLCHDQLYIGTGKEEDAGYFYLYVEKPEEGGKKDFLTLEEAVKDTDHHISFLFAREMLPVEDKERAAAVVEEIGGVLAGERKSERYMLWLSDVNRITAGTVDVLGLDAAAGKVTVGLEKKLLPNLICVIWSGSVLEWREDAVYLPSDRGGSMTFGGKLAVAMSSVRGEKISYSGESMGCIGWKCSVNLGEMAKKLTPGFYYSYGEDEENGGVGFSFMRPDYPKRRGTGTDFYVQLDLMDTVNRKGNAGEDGCGKRSFFAFLGRESDGGQTVFASWFQTIYGKPLFLRPVGRLLFSSEGGGGILLEPEGDFVLTGTGVEGKSLEGSENLPETEEEILLLCGLSGTEFFRLHRNDCMCFRSGKPAFAKNFPVKTVSTVGEPVDLHQPLLEGRTTTSWLALKSDRGVEYISQPRGSAHYTTDEKNGVPILCHDQSGISVHGAEEVYFPCVPYGGMAGGKCIPGSGIGMAGGKCIPGSGIGMVGGECIPDSGVGMVGGGYISGGETAMMGWVQDYEKTILAVVRKQKLDVPLSLELEQMRMGQRMREEAQTDREKKGERELLFAKGYGEGEDGEFTTPAGQVVIRSPEGVWKRVVFANGSYLGEVSRLYLEQPHDLLRQSLEASSLFLVVANQDYLGDITGSAEDLGRMSFHNGIRMEDWKFEITPGKKSVYNGYRNIMIVKGRKGKIFDPLDGEREAGQAESLAANPSLWTNAGEMGAPSWEGKGTGDEDQLVNLATWMMGYCREAYQNREDEYFREFCQIIQDEEWQGVLFLNIPLEREFLPGQLQGLMSGLSDSTDIHVHHIGIKTSPVSVEGGRLKQEGSSSLFGLIYFQDQQFRGKPVLPEKGTYDFKLLELKVLFANSEVKKFASHAQLTLNELFGLQVSSVEGDSSAYHSVLLSGIYQNDNGVSCYRLRNERDCKFCFKEKYIHGIRIDNVTMARSGEGEQNYRFDLEGSMDFAIWKGEEASVDFLSLGKEEEALVDFLSLEKEEGGSVDFLSFGTEDGRGEGLKFRNLGISLQEAREGANGQKQRSMKLDISNLIFDVEKSLVRQNSLVENLNLQLEEMVEGAEGNPPSDLGYLQVSTDWSLRGVQGRWYGLVFALDMGTLGELAGKAGMVSRLLIAFGPGQEKAGGAAAGKVAEEAWGEIYLGIRLPGSGKTDFLSLQNLLKLSVDQIWLKYDQERRAFLLLFTNIALKLLGLLSVPPAGSTMFYLFGDTGTEKNKELGWYAVYKKEKKALEERGRGQGV